MCALIEIASRFIQRGPTYQESPRQTKPRYYWPRGSTGVQRYGCIPRSAANKLGEIPKNLGAPNLLFSRVFGWRERLGLVPASLPHTLGCACTCYAPTSPPPKEKSRIKKWIKLLFSGFGCFPWENKHNSHQTVAQICPR